MSQSRSTDWESISSQLSPPSISMTGNGHEYVRCQVGSDDSTVYLHQLDAIAGGADPHRVFADGTCVRHILRIEWLNTPENVELIGDWERDPDDLRGDRSGDVFDLYLDPEVTKSGVPQSEYDRLSAIEVDSRPSEVSNNLRRHIRDSQ